MSRGAEADRARLEAILESSSSIIVALDTRYHLTDLNGAARRILGLTDEDIGRFLGDIIDPRRTADTPERREELLSILHGASATFDTYLLAPDGTERTIDFTLAPIRGTDGEVVGISAIGRDVTGERRDEEQRRNLAAVVESAHDPILAARPDGTVLSWNRAAEVAFGARAADVLGRPLVEVLPAWLGGAELAVEERIARGEAIADVEVVSAAADGTQTHHAVSAFPVRDETARSPRPPDRPRRDRGGGPARSSCARRSGSRRSGSLAGGIAHDFNNLLTVILGYAELLARRAAGRAERARRSRRSSSAARQRGARSRGSCSRSAASRSLRADDASTSNEVVAGVRADAASGCIGEDVELSVRARTATCARSCADPAQLEQVAHEPRRQRARRDARRRHAARSTTETVPTLDAGHRACVDRRRDTGTASTPETLEHIFEPFFTTKEIGQRHGARPGDGARHRHAGGGRVDGRATPGQGSTFRVLPAGGAARTRRSPTRGARGTGGPVAGRHGDGAAVRGRGRPCGRCSSRILAARGLPGRSRPRRGARRSSSRAGARARSTCSSPTS